MFIDRVGGGFGGKILLGRGMVMREVIFDDDVVEANCLTESVHKITLVLYATNTAVAITIDDSDSDSDGY